MSAISGFCNLKDDFLLQKSKYAETLKDMGEALKHRGPKEKKLCLYENIALSLNQLDEINEHDYDNFLIIFDGELYNKKELKEMLETEGYIFRSGDSAEIILASFLHCGTDCGNMLNGVFAFAIWDKTKRSLFLCRDRLGIKPLFYTLQGDTIVFASEIKALLKFPGIKPQLDHDGLCELFGLFPSRTEGNGIFKNIKEIKYGCYAIFNENSFEEKKYWQLESKENHDTYDEAVEKAKFLLTDAVKRQMTSESPLCSFLSGGIDSSIVTAITANELSIYGETLDTFSFDYEDNSLYFKANSFQVDSDKKWAIKMVDLFQTNHQFLECSIHDLIENLYSAVDARDLPGMADVDSSLLYFCKQVSETHGVALTGECSDELFGGYPWFHSREAFETNSFPWIRNTDFRKMLLSDDLLNKIDIDSYIQQRYDETIASVPKLDSDTKEVERQREILYLNIKWFMTNLIDRMDRMSMYSSLSARVPYADYRLVEFLWNIPWEIKCNGTPKSLLREAFKDLLPEELINRKKSPYPKTYNPLYENLLKEKLQEVLDNPSSPILSLLNKEKVLDFLKMDSDYGKPWYGQLMAGPQLIAFYLQVNYWLEKYEVEIL